MKSLTIAIASLVLCSCMASAECTAAEEKEIAAVRDAWMNSWNAKQLDNVMKLYASEATYLSPDGQRFSGREKIRAFFETILNSKAAASGVSLDCSGDFAYESGTYTQDFPGGSGMMGNSKVLGTATVTEGGGKHSEGNYLVVLKRQDGKWLLVQHASTAKP
jgi:ketosteroid isomerase-like protein